MQMRVGWAVLAAVRVDREDALGTSGSDAESLLDGIAQDAIRKESVEPLKALGRGVVDGQDEADVGRIPETAAVLTKGLATRTEVFGS
jgi:hypothetical protein